MVRRKSPYINSNVLWSFLVELVGRIEIITKLSDDFAFNFQFFCLLLNVITRRCFVERIDNIWKMNRNCHELHVDTCVLFRTLKNYLWDVKSLWQNTLTKRWVQYNRIHNFMPWICFQVAKNIALHKIYIWYFHLVNVVFRDSFKKFKKNSTINNFTVVN